MTAHREAARHPWTEPGVQADSSVALLVMELARNWLDSDARSDVPETVTTTILQ